MPPDQIAIQLARLETKTDQQTDVLERLDHAVNGNGKPGLRVEVDRLIQASLSQERAKREGRWLIRTVVAAVVALVARDVYRTVYPHTAINADAPSTQSAHP